MIVGNRRNFRKTKRWTYLGPAMLDEGVSVAMLWLFDACCQSIEIVHHGLSWTIVEGRVERCQWIGDNFPIYLWLLGCHVRF